MRLRMLRLLEAEELSVGEVAKVLQLPQSTVSRHLKVLSDGLWLTKRTAKTATYYRLTPDDMAADARSLWRAVREPLAAAGEFEEDARRLAAVLADRRTDSLAFFGRVAGEWDVYRNELFGDRFTERGLLSLVSSDWVVADVGCGTGNAAELLAPVVERVIAIDQSEPMLEAARRRLLTGGATGGRVEFRLGSAEALPLEAGAVDAVVCSLLLHHVEGLDAAVREFARVLRRGRGGGVLLVVDMVKHERSEFRAAMGHKHLGFGEAEMVDLLTRNGFETPRVRHLPGDAEAKGPGLFAATGRVRG